MTDSLSFIPEDARFRQPFDAKPIKYNWYISSDKVFSSKVDGMTDFAPISGIEFCVSRFSLFDGTASSDSAVAAQDVKVYMESGPHCAMIQSFLAKGEIVPSITVKKTVIMPEKIQPLEEKVFSGCVVQSFALQGEAISFSFRYSSYSDTYTALDDTGAVKGTAAVKVDLVKWEITSE
ncbi:MAG: hypothetical protein LBO73_02475 [Holosporaceae bacterium]|nr:hypothetical protein [Holosporaceae bacterium]